MQLTLDTRLVVAAIAGSFWVVACTGSTNDAALDRQPGDAAEPAEITGTDRVDALGCDRETIGEQEGALVAALAVENGEVVGLCFGTPDDRLDDAWAELVAITPDAELADIDLIAGYDEVDSESLAFAAMIGDGNEDFVVAVNLPLAEADPEELRLTLAHEVSHVFAQTPDQLDVNVDQQDCTTYFNGNGCMLEDAYVMRWIEAFWSEEELASMPDPATPDEVGADDRCSLDPSFLGPYAASHPEEDFAESFSAFVFGLDVAPSVQPKLDFFEQFPELVDFREKVDAANLPSPPNNFDECG